MDNQPQNPMPNPESERAAPATATPADPLSKGWSWGGFIFDPIVFIAAKKYWYLLLYVLMFIPLVNLFAMIGIKLFAALKGAQIVRQSTAFINDDEKRGFLRGLDRAGFIFFIVLLVFFALGLIFFVIAGATFFSEFQQVESGIQFESGYNY